MPEFAGNVHGVVVHRHARLPRERPRHERELHKNRRILTVRVLHFSLGQRRLCSGAPVHRLLALVHQPLLDEACKRPDHLRLVCRIERQIWMLPLAQHPKPLELPALNPNIFSRIFLRPLPHLQRREPSRFLHHLEFDRQSVAVPPRHERRAPPQHRLRFHDNILQHLVEGRPHVHIPIRKRRPVMQHKERCIRTRRKDALVQPARLPFGKPFRLALDQVRLHRESGFREVQRIFVILLTHFSGNWGATGNGTLPTPRARCTLKKRR